MIDFLISNFRHFVVKKTKSLIRLIQIFFLFEINMRGREDGWGDIVLAPAYIAGSSDDFEVFVVCGRVDIS